MDRLTRCSTGPRVQFPRVQFDGLRGFAPHDPREEQMSSTASLITLLASVAFALIVIAVVVRVAPQSSSS